MTSRVFELHIEHDPIKTTTPKMLLWWFANINGEMTYQGKTYPKYLVWHPKDYIHWSLAKQPESNQVGTGSYFRIVEAFNRKPYYLVDSIERVQKLDETGIRLVKRIGTTEIFSLQLDFKQEGHHTLYKSKMTIGSTKFPVNKLLNFLIIPLFFTEAMAKAWLVHNIEEVGNFEYFLPELYETEMSKSRKSIF